ncbi:MAG TPA: DUF1577 domain-containing protein [Spirochaetota bacterium]|nr:DUF1577 domain-containing protein [Spirochaetota bacterium]
MQVQERKAREYIPIRDQDEISELIETRLATKNKFLKNPLEKIQVSVREYKPDNTLDLITDPEFEPQGLSVTIYSLLDSYIEIDLEIIEKTDAGMFHCRITGVQKAVHGRKNLRFKITSDQAVATNFRVSRQALDIGLFTIPTGIKVLLDQFQSSNSNMSDIVKVDIFRNDDNILIKGIKKTRRAGLITDTSNAASYDPAGEEFLDCRAVFGEGMEKVIKNNIDKGYKSILVTPILYINEAENVVPFGYIQLVSKSSPLTMETAVKLKKDAEKLVERIRDANTAFLPVRQEIMDISRGGARLRISDNELKKLLARTPAFTFDLVFKLEAPITMYAETCSSFKDENDRLVIGVDFQGTSSRKNEMRRFNSYIDPMEQNYKAQLRKSMGKS